MSNIEERTLVIFYKRVAKKCDIKVSCLTEWQKGGFTMLLSGSVGASNFSMRMDLAVWQCEINKMYKV